jgi:hypothetical protein
VRAAALSAADAHLAAHGMGSSEGLAAVLDGPGPAWPAQNEEEDVDGDDSGWSEEWKVLLLDSHTRAIVSPLLTVRELRALGVTLHLALEAPRDPIPDVSAVYLVRPTAAALRAILDDAASARYRDPTQHFCAPQPRPSLEALARGCVEAGAAARASSGVSDGVLDVAELAGVGDAPHLEQDLDLVECRRVEGGEGGLGEGGGVGLAIAKELDLAIGAVDNQKLH